MPETTDPKAEEKNKKHDDAYFADQWARTQAEQKKRDEARRRAWYAWQREQKDRAPYSAWLDIPCNAADAGLRPLPPGTPHWASPFIWVESPDPSGKPVAGAENHLVAQVFNLGAATSAPTKVDFYWADPSVGLGAADAHFIGTEWVEVTSMGSKVVRCNTPWVPEFLNGGHECAFVMCDNHVLDPLLHPFQPWADRHVGQRNLSVLPAAAPMEKFKFWAPAAGAGQFAELRVMALRGVAPKGLALQGNAVRTLQLAAHQLLRGQRHAPLQTQRGVKALPFPEIFGEHIAFKEIIRNYRILEDVRPLKGGDERAKDERKATSKVKGKNTTAADDIPFDPQTVGEVLTRIEGAPKTARLVELELQAPALGMNELIVLNLTHINGGVVQGGYVLVFANPAWLTMKEKDFPNLIARGDAMQETKNDDDLKSRIIEYNPQARMTYQLAQQLAGSLPISSFERLSDALKEVTVDTQRLPLSLFAPHIAKDMFPIQDVDDLVRKLSAGVRLALTQAAQPAGELIAPAPVKALVASALSVEPGRKASIPSGHFTGPSIYGYTRAKGG